LFEDYDTGVTVRFFLRTRAYEYPKQQRDGHPDMKRQQKDETENTVEAIFRGQSRMTARGQITVPTEVRKKFGLRPGDILCFLEIEGTVILKLGPLVLTE